MGVGLASRRRYAQSFSLLAYSPNAGAGNAAYFQWTRNAVIGANFVCAFLTFSRVGLHWTDTPDGDFTVEHWIFNADPHQRSQNVVAYSVYSVSGHDGRGSEIYQETDELAVGFSASRLVVTVAGDAAQCTTKQCLRFYTDPFTWMHVAAAFNVSHGLTTVYVNGSVVGTLRHLGRHSPVHAGGVLHLGQDADSSVWSGFDEAESFDGMVDELRVWSRIRTADEIAATFAQAVDTTVEPDLVLYYNFDNLEYDAQRNVLLLPDLTGRGNSAFWGMMPTISNVLQYRTERGLVTPEEPRLFPSKAPLIADGVVTAFWNAAENAPIEINLPAFDESGLALVITISSTPHLGSLRRIDSEAILRIGETVTPARVVYIPPSNQTLLMKLGEDSFVYSASNGVSSATAMVRVLSTSVPDPSPAEIKVTCDEDTATYVALGSISYSGSPLDVVIDELPHHGTLYQSLFKSEVETYSKKNLKHVAEVGTAILSRNTRIADRRGVVIFVPHPNEDRAATFTYFFRDSETGVQSKLGAVRVEIVAKIDPPQPKSTSASVEAGGRVAIMLDADFVDTNFAAFPNATLSRFPTYGQLYQLMEDDEDGAEINHSQPEAEEAQWATQLVRFSSQRSRCGEECTSWLNPTCGALDFHKVPSSFSEPQWIELSTSPANVTACNDLGWHASQILGNADAYPAGANLMTGWTPSTQDFGTEWIELRLSTAMYVTSVAIYEIYNPSAVQKILVTDNYVDDNTIPCSHDNCSTLTSWHVLWEGQAGAIGAFMANELAPPVCMVPVLAEVVRIELDTASVLGWNNIDAVRILGHQHLPSELVVAKKSTMNASFGNWVMYKPHAGVHGVDTFEFVAENCEAVSLSVGEVLVNITPPTDRPGVFSDLPPFAVTLSVDSEMISPYVAGSSTIAMDFANELRVTSGNETNLTVELRAVSGGGQLSFGGSAWNIGERNEVATAAEARVEFTVDAIANLSVLSPEDALAVYNGNGEVSISPRITRKFELWVHGANGAVFQHLAISCLAGFVALYSDSVPEEYRYRCLLCNTVYEATWFVLTDLSTNEESHFMSVCGLQLDSSRMYDCSLGYYFDGSTFACEKCRAGTIGDATRATNCSQCAPGSFAPVEGTSRCIKCDHRSYTSRFGSRNCTRCPVHTKVMGSTTGSSSLWDCIPEEGYYSREWPIYSEAAHKCPSGARCDGGLTQPYPKSNHWMLPEYWKAPISSEQQAKAYRCRYGHLCRGGNSPATCAQSYDSLQPGKCIDAQGQIVTLPDIEKVNWCTRRGNSVTQPMCEDEKTSKSGPSYFSLSTKVFLCPSPKGPKRALFTAMQWILLLTLFVVINEVIRPQYPVLDTVLETYQDLGILGGHQQCPDVYSRQFFYLGAWQFHSLNGP